jgi:hypothetical protein
VVGCVGDSCTLKRLERCGGAVVGCVFCVLSSVWLVECVMSCVGLVGVSCTLKRLGLSFGGWGVSLRDEVAFGVLSGWEVDVDWAGVGVDWGVVLGGGRGREVGDVDCVAWDWGVD